MLSLEIAPSVSSFFAVFEVLPLENLVQDVKCCVRLFDEKCKSKKKSNGSFVQYGYR